jgi:16S rRNA (uracil1498-N3)-methyltransferase
MKQFLLPSDYAGAAAVTLSGRDHHYLRHVLRLKRGDSFTGRDREGRLYRLTIEDEREQSFLLHSERKAEETTQPAARLTLYQCLPKGAKMDQIVRQATEAGISRIVPLIGEHTISIFSDAERAEKRRCRWERIAREALQQSGVARAPTVESPVGFEGVLNRERGCDLLFNAGVRDCVSLHELLASGPSVVNLVVGPEGGFSAREIESFLNEGFREVSLADSTLRVETAALYAIAAVQILLLELNSWKTV